MLRPFNPAQEALAIAGILKESGKDKDENKIKATLDSHGASIDDAAAALAIALRNPEENSWAPKLAFQLHGALREAEVPSIPNINITVVTSNESKNLLTFVTPIQNDLEEETQ